MQTGRDWRGLMRRATEMPLTRYAIAILMVTAVAGFRAAFDEGLGSGAYFILYYPAFVVIAYALGTGPVFVSIGVALLFSYFAFTETEARADPTTTVRLALYTLSSTMVALVVIHVRDRLAALSQDLAKVSALTRGQADLFREHAERVSNHLQLISALLELNANDEAAGESARVLRNAASRTMLISRMHRSYSSNDIEPIDFAAFAARLADSALEGLGRPPLSIVIEGQLSLLPEQATSLSLILLECINARAKAQPCGVMTVGLTSFGAEGVLTVTEDAGGAQDARLLGALAEQMKGRLVLGQKDRHGILRLAFPTEAQPLPKWDPLSPLH